MTRVSREDIQVVGRDCVGIPFLKGGKTQGGVDCAGLVKLVRDRLHLETEYPEFKEIYVEPRGCSLPPEKLMGEYCRANLTEIDREDSKGGDVVTFNITGRGEEHMGILIDDAKFGQPFRVGVGLLHVTRQSELSKIIGITEKWWKKLAKVYRFPEVID